MKRTTTAVGLALLLASAGAAPAQGVANPALELARIKQGVKSRSVSSYDVTGGNADHLSARSRTARAARSST